MPIRLAARRAAPVPAALALLLALAGTGGMRQAAAAAGLPGAVPPAALAQAQQLIQQAAAAPAPAQARVEVEWLPPDPRLQLAACSEATPYLMAGLPVWGRTRVGLRCVRGATWNIGLPLVVRVWAPGVVSATALPAGATLQAGQLQLAAVDWAANPSPPLAALADVQGRVLARATQAGQALRLADLQPRQWFAAGDPVRILAVGNGFVVRGQGQALTAGTEGRQARVRTDSGRVVEGLPVGDREVELRW